MGGGVLDKLCPSVIARFANKFDDLEVTNK